MGSLAVATPLVPSRNLPSWRWFCFYLLATCNHACWLSEWSEVESVGCWFRSRVTIWQPTSRRLTVTTVRSADSCNCNIVKKVLLLVLRNKRLCSYCCDCCRGYSHVSPLAAVQQASWDTACMRYALWFRGFCTKCLYSTRCKILAPRESLASSEELVADSLFLAT